MVTAPGGARRGVASFIKPGAATNLGRLVTPLTEASTARLHSPLYRTLPQ
jgi:hypothetical protein